MNFGDIFREENREEWRALGGGGVVTNFCFHSVRVDAHDDLSVPHEAVHYIDKVSV